MEKVWEKLNEEFVDLEIVVVDSNEEFESFVDEFGWYFGKRCVRVGRKLL